MKCKAKNDIPYTCGITSMIYWEEEPCKNECNPNSSYCFLHQGLEIEEKRDIEALNVILKTLEIKKLEEK